MTHLGAYSVRRFRATERISTPYAIEVEADAVLDPGDRPRLGARARLVKSRTALATRVCTEPGPGGARRRACAITTEPGHRAGPGHVRRICGCGCVCVSAADRDPKKLAAPRDAATKRVNVRVWDEQLTPLRNKKYAFTVLGEVISGVTSPTGELDIDVPEEAEVGQLTVWKEHPEGERLQWKVDLQPPLPPPHRAPGARIRLSNLGYYQGLPVVEMDERLERAIRRFQEDTSLPVTGNLDALTVYELLVMHGD